MTDMTWNREALWWIVSYPKSGNTWLRMMLHHYAREAHINKNLTAFDDLNEYLYRSVAPAPLGDMGFTTMAMLRPAVLAHLRELETGPLLVKSHHMHGSVFGVPLFSPAWTDKVIYVLRDPRAVLPSLADHLGESIEHTIRFMTTEHSPQLDKTGGLFHQLGSWEQHVRSWTSGGAGGVLVVRYEDMHKDTEGELRRCVEHLDMPVDDSLIAEAVGEHTFEKMRQMEKERGFAERSDVQDRFFRRGETDGWRDELTQKQVSDLLAKVAPMMRELGYLEPEAVTA